MLLLYLLERLCYTKWNLTLITLTLSLLIAPFATMQLPVNMIAVKRLHWPGFSPKKQELSVSFKMQKKRLLQ